MYLAFEAISEGQVHGHDLGDRRGIARAVGLLSVEHFAGLGVDDDGRVFGLRREEGYLRLGRGDGPDRENRHKQSVKYAAGEHMHQPAIRRELQRHCAAIQAYNMPFLTFR